MTDGIQRYTPAQIAKINDIKVAVHVKNMAEAAAVFYAAQDAWDQAQKAQEYRLRAVRAAGRILLPPAQGGMTPREKPGPNSGDGDSRYLQLLEDAGISHGTAQTWQKVGRIPDDKFEAYLAEAEYWQDEFTITGLLKFSGEWFGKSNITEWETPDWLFDLLRKEFKLDLDVCANKDNAKCADFFSPKEDGLKQTWAPRRCWMNPPYGRAIKDWMSKAKEEAQAGATVVCLVPARPDTEWWWENALAGEIRFIRGRLKWPESDTVAPFPSTVIILSSDVQRGKVVWWDVRTKAGLR